MMASSPFTYRRIVMWIGRIVLGVLFLYAGYSKLVLPNMHPHPPIKIALSLFALQVDSYQMLPPWGVNLVAHTLPFAEIVLGLLLILGWQLRIWATLVSLVVLVLFVAVTHSYAKGMQINCGCFANPEPLTIWTVIRDGLLLALAVLMTVFAYIEAREKHPWAAQT